MPRRRATPDTIEAWAADMKEIAQRVERLQSEISARPDLIALDTRPAHRELASIAEAVKAAGRKLAAAKRAASGPHAKWTPKPAPLDKAKEAARRLMRK